jgi:chromosome partitioning protein
VSHATTLGTNKGGPGKTTTCINLGCALARAGYTVLWVDLDPQGNLTRRVGAQLTPDTATAAEIIEAGATREYYGCAADAIVPAGIEADYSGRLKVIGATIDLTNRSNEFHVPGAINRLRNALKGATEGIDVILYDTGPGFGLLQQMALAASDDVLIVVQPETDGTHGGGRLSDFVLDRADAIGVPDLRILGYIANLVRMNTAVHKDNMSQLPGYIAEGQPPARLGARAPAYLWEPYIPNVTKVLEAGEHNGGPGAAIERHGTVGREIASRYDQLAKRYTAEAGLQ